MNILASHESILGEAEVSATTYALLAGLMFSASTLFYSIEGKLIHRDFLIIIALIATIFFIFATIQCEGAATKAREGKKEIDLKRIKSANILAFFGFLLMLGDLGFIGFITGMFYGVIVIAVAIILLIYITKVIP